MVSLSLIMIVFILKKAYSFFEIYLGWIFINGHKQEAWARYLKTKYSKVKKKKEKMSLKEEVKNLFIW
jgi:hypothetical protein